MLCSEYNTANYCPVLLLKISIRTFGTYALCTCLHSPREKAKKSSVHTFQQKSAHLEKNRIRIMRLYSPQFSSLLDMPVGKGMRQDCTSSSSGREEVDVHRPGGGQRSSGTFICGWMRLDNWAIFRTLHQQQMWLYYRLYKSIIIHFRTFFEERKRKKKEVKKIPLYCNHGYYLILDIA